MNKKQFIIKLLHSLIASSLLFSVSSCLSTKNTGTPVAQGASLSGANANGAVLGFWNQNDLPLNIKFSDQFLTSEITSMQDVTLKWQSEVESVVTLFDFSGGTIANKDLLDPNDYFDAKIEVHKVYGNALDQQILAVTNYTANVYNEGLSNEVIELIDADILFNYGFVSFSNTGEQDKYDLQTIILHEMGHLIGFGHVPTNIDSVMTTTLAKGIARTNLFTIDMDMMQINYGDEGNSQLASQQNSFALLAAKTPPDKVVIVSIELRKDGDCRHIVDGMKVSSHPTKSFLIKK